MSLIYRFGTFRLDPAAREFWRGEELLELPRLVFEGLVLLVENRGRAVSRGELIEAVWGRPYVEDILVTQLIMRLRRMIGDDSQKPRYIRTVAGFGYHWIADTEVSVVQRPGDDKSIAARPDIKATPSGALDQSGTGASWLRRRRVLVPALLLCLMAVILAYFFTRDSDVTLPLSREPGIVVAVLPLEIDAHERADVGWVRLGVMDLIADSLRDAGLPVSPSDSVIAALHAAADREHNARHATLRRTLDAGVLVEGRAVQVAGDWTIELNATTDAGDRRRVVSDPGDILPSAGQAADLLLAALGRTVPEREGEAGALDQTLRRARSAMLALELETARAILTEALEESRDEPALLHELAWVEFRSGDLDEAESIATRLIEDPAVRAMPRLYAKSLMLQGIVEINQYDDWVVGQPYIDQAVGLLADDPWDPELGTALVLRAGAHVSRHDFDAAASDLGWARTLAETSGDRLGLARVYNYLGNAEVARGNLAGGIHYLEKSNEIVDSFAHVEWQRANLIGLLRAQRKMLDWHAALATSDRLWELRERIQSIASRGEINAQRAAILLALGRYREAGEVLAEVMPHLDDIPVRVVHTIFRVRARLAWREDRWRETLDAAAQALELWPGTRSPTASQPTETALLYQRAAIALGDAAAATEVLPVSPEIEQDPAFLVARAEWAAFQGDNDQAERWFQEAAAQAERVPADLTLVADAHSRWLLANRRYLETIAWAGRVVGWADSDYDSALLQVRIFHANDRREAWAVAVGRARRLAAEREIPAELLQSPHGP